MFITKLLKVVMPVFVLYGAYYFIEQYELRQAVKLLNEINYVKKEELTRLSVVSYPAMDAYSTGDVGRVKEDIRALSKLDVKANRKLKESEIYYKVKFSDSKNFQTISYIFYENNNVKREEYVAGIGKTQFFITEDTLFEDMFYPLLAAEMSK